MVDLKLAVAVVGLALANAGSAPAAFGAEQGLSYIVPAQSGSTEGQPVPDVIFADGSGMPIHLNRYVGFVVVLSFWSQQCGPCIKQMTYLDRLQGNFRGQKLLVLPVSVDPGGAPAAKAFFAKYHFTYLRPFADPGASMARALGVGSLPTTFVIDKTGKAIGRFEGEKVWDSEDMMQRLNWLLVRP